jgi:hypothetical protein
VIAMLPNLIKSAQALEETTATDEAWRLSARIHHLAATTLAKVGEADLAWIAAERAMAAAEQSGDPLALASAARAGTHALLAVGGFHDALSLGQTAAGGLASQADPAGRSSRAEHRRHVEPTDQCRGCPSTGSQPDWQPASRR